MAGKFLNFFKPFVRIMPEVRQPQKEITFKKKLMFTFLVLVVYLIMSNIPIYMGDLDPETGGTDYYFWMRTILASKRGFLTELGIGPIVTAGLIMQLLQGSKLIRMNMGDPVDRALFTGAQKVVAMFLTLFQTAAYIWGGAYGDPEEFAANPGIAIGIFIQLFTAGVVIMLLDEILQKGYGLGSGISLFIAAGVAGDVFWQAFSYIDASDGLPTGIFIAMFSVIGNEEIGFWDLFVRSGGSPSILGLITTVIIFLAVIYVQTMTVEIPLTYAGYKGYRGKYPMKLLYVSNIPVILAQALYANVLFFGQLLYKNSSDNWTKDANFFVKWIGNFDEGGANSGGNPTPTGGLAYYLTPPQGLSAILDADASEAGTLITHSVIYLCLFMIICIYFAKIWIEVSGLAPRDIAEQIINSKMQIPGFRRSEKRIEKVLKRYIPTLTILCGMIVGILSFTADFLGSLSSGTGLLLTVGILQKYAEDISEEVATSQMMGGGGALGGLLG